MGTTSNGLARDRTALSEALSNLPPSVDVGLDQRITLADSALLVGAVSDDGLPNPPDALTVTWSQLSGPGTVTFGNRSEALTTATFSATGTYVLRLTASDGDLSASDDVAITVNTAHPNTVLVPQDHLTIQAGIDAAQVGDLVLVSPGTYVENLYVPRTLTLASTSYTTGDESLIDQTVISSPVSDTATIIVSSGAGAETKIVGFTIRNGSDGIKIRGKVKVLNNHLDLARDAVDFSSGSAGLVQDNVIENNGDDGVDIDHASVLIRGNLMQTNAGDGVEIRALSNSGPMLVIIIRDNMITANTDDGIQLIDDDTIADTAALLVIDRNLIASNVQAGFGLMDNGTTHEDYRAASLLERIHLFNNTFVGNDHGVTGGDNLIAINNVFVDHPNVAVKQIDGDSVVSYNLFWNNGTDDQGSNLDLTTTLFANPNLDAEYRLQPGSPAIDAGTALFTLPSGETVLDLSPGEYFGVAPDLGKYESTYGSSGNSPPTVDAGPDQSITLPTSNVSLAGTVTDDGNPDPPGVTTSAWSQVSGTPGVVFGNPNDLETTATFPGAGVYVLRLTASDSEWASSDELAVTVIDPFPGWLDVRVAAGSDDAEERSSGRVYLDSSDLELVFDARGDQVVGIRFTGVSIPRDALITNAYLQFQVDEVNTVATSLTIEGQAADDSATYTATDGDVSGRPRTAAAVSWAPPAWNTVGEAGPDQQTPDIASIIQEIVDRPGWASGNSLAIIVSGTGERTAESYNGDQVGAPLLRVEYSTEPTNDPPVASNDSASTPEDTAVSIDVAANDSDPDGNLDPATANSSCANGSGGCLGAGNGSLTDNGDGTITYTPAPDFNGGDSFVYEICDTVGACDTATVNLTITAVNDPPLANDDVGTVAEGGTLNEPAPGVLSNDSDPENDLLAVTSTPVTPPTNGTLTLLADGSYTYIHDGSETVSDSFVYEVCDPEPLCSTATVNLTITGVNDAPLATDDTGTVAQGGTLNEPAPGVLSNDSDPENDPLAVTSTPVTPPTNGTLTLNADGSYSYTHDGSETVSDSFVYEVCDPEPLCYIATVNLTITGVNDPPLANDDVGTVAEGGTLNEPAPGVLSNDSDPENDPLAVTTTPVTPPTNGSLTLFADGSYTYIHDGSETVSDSFVYEVCAPEPLCDTATVNLTITAVNDPPLANDDVGTVAEGGTLNEPAPGVLSNDSDPENDPLAVTSTPVTPPTNGTLTLNADGSYSYIHDGSETVSDSFVYEVCDPEPRCDTATVNLTITPANDPPVATDDVGTVAEGGTLNEPAPGVLSNDSDPENDLLAVTTTPVTPPTNGSVTLLADGSYTYIHDGSETVSDSFVYEVCDPEPLCSTATVNLTITAVNDPPLANDDVGTVAEGGTLNEPAPGVLSNDSDPENDPLAVTTTPVTPPTNGSVTLLADGSYTYVHDGSETTSDSFVYEVCDPEPLCDTATVNLTITGVNDPPVATDDVGTVAEGGTLNEPAPGVLSNDSDPENDLLAVTTTPVTPPTNGSVTLLADGSYTYIHDGSETASDSFVYEVCDPEPLCDTAAVAITVNPSAPEILEVRVMATSDDAEEKATGRVGLTSNDLELVFDKEIQIVGIRFNGVAIPQDANITDAYVQFQADETQSEPTALTLQGEANDNAPTFVNSTNNITNREMTTASVAWAPQPWTTRGEAGPDQQTPDIASVIQEIVNRPNWSSGNSLVLIITGSGKRVAESYNGDQAGAPLLHVEYNVGPPNDPPQANDDNASTSEDTAVTIDVAANDSDPEGSLDLASANTSCTSCAEPASGSLVDNGDGSFGYTPSPDYHGPDSFVYEICDTRGACDTALVSITIDPVADAPVAGDDAYSTEVDTVLSVAAPGVLGDDSDADGDSLTAILVSDVSSGSLTLNADGAFTYDPDPGFVGTDSFTYRANDGSVDSNVATVTITVTPSAPVTVEVRVAASSDDAEEKASGRVGLTSSDLELVFDKEIQIVGIRFNGVAIPQDPNITDAYIQFQADETQSEATALTLQGEANDNAPTFVNSTNNITNREMTTASVAWAPQPWTTRGEAGPDQQTPDIASVIQEIVNRPNWSSGNSLVLIITGSGKRVAESYNGDQDGAPLLHVEYSSGP